MTDEKKESVRSNPEQEVDSAEELAELMKEWCVPSF